MAMPVKVMDYWVNRYTEVIRDRKQKLEEEKGPAKQRLLASKKKDFYKVNNLDKDLKKLKKIQEDKAVLVKKLQDKYGFMKTELERRKHPESNYSYDYGYSTPNRHDEFIHKFESLMLDGFQEWWLKNTDEGKQIGELSNMSKHIKDAVYASATPKNLLTGLETVMKSLDANTLLNGGAKPLLEELNTIVEKS